MMGLVWTNGLYGLRSELPVAITLSDRQRVVIAGIKYI